MRDRSWRTATPNGGPILGRRPLLLGAAALIASPALARAQPVDAIVGRADGHDGIPRHPSLTAALAAAPRTADTPFRILIGEGRFPGQVTIDRPRIHLIGLGGGRSVLTSSHGACDIAADGKPYGTFRTATLEIAAPDVELHDLTIENAFDAPAEMRRPGGHRADDPGSQQAIALSLARAADRTIVTGCTITSHQDTLYCADGRALFRHCRITGSYDFIFGGASARFEACEIRSRLRVDPVEGYIAAPSTMIDRPVGLVFDRCTLTAEPGVPAGSVYLGRPWRLSTTIDGHRMGDPRSVGMAAYVGCLMGPHIAPAGWTRMWYTGADGNPRTMFEPEDARFVEYASRGAGARGTRRGRILSAAQARGLSRSAMFGDWTPSV